MVHWFVFLLNIFITEVIKIETQTITYKQYQITKHDTKQTKTYFETRFTKGVGGVITPNCFVIKRISLFGISMQVITSIQIKRKKPA